MSVSGLCEICNRADISHTCDRCGRLVCEDHFDDEVGFCVDCAAEVGRAGDRDGEKKGEYPDGVGEYRF